MAHLPAPGRPVPVSTYRVQLRPPADDHPGFGFDDAASVVPYLADLGVTHLYCSPWLQAVHARGPVSLIGRVAEVAIDAVQPHSLSGRLSLPGIRNPAPAVHQARMAH